MTEQELKSKISKMTLKEKALELTQYNYGDLMKGYEDLTVTGMNVDGDRRYTRLPHKLSRSARHGLHV